jgi:hypothetical protein
VRKSLGLFVATAALAGSIFTAAPAQAWTCAINDEYVPEAVGDAVCLVVMTAAGTVCRALPPACFG